MKMKMKMDKKTGTAVAAKSAGGRRKIGLSRAAKAALPPAPVAAACPTSRARGIECGRPLTNAEIAAVAERAGVSQATARSLFRQSRRNTVLRNAVRIADAAAALGYKVGLRELAGMAPSPLVGTRRGMRARTCTASKLAAAAGCSYTLARSAVTGERVVSPLAARALRHAGRLLGISLPLMRVGQRNVKAIGARSPHTGLYECMAVVAADARVSLGTVSNAVYGYRRLSQSAARKVAKAAAARGLDVGRMAVGR